MNKILFFDTETTGTNPEIHEITQFAALIEIDGKIVEEINWRCQPTRWDMIEIGALTTTGITLEQLKTFESPAVMYERILVLFQNFVSKYDKAPLKFWPAGHNVGFDLDFLNAFFKQHGDAETKKWGITSYQNWRALDTRVIANFLAAAGKLPCADMKLGTLCSHYGIALNAHDALSDIRATRELLYKFRSMI